MRFDIITIFPKIFDGFLNESLLARAQKPRRTQNGRGSDPKASEKKPLIKIGVHNLRKWTTDKHQTVDDKPYGGGVGMILKIEPIYKAVQALKSKNKKNKTHIILFSPRGKKFDQKTAKRLSKYDQLILISGRYEGVDERVATHIANEVVSIGDYVLNGGEVATMVLMETVCRLIPGFIAKKESAEKEDHAQYTRPDIFKLKGRSLKVPAVLMSGDHKKIAAFRRASTLKGRAEWRKKNTRDWR